MFSAPKSNRQDRATMSRGRGTPVPAFKRTVAGSGTPSKNPAKQFGMTLKEKLNTLDQFKTSRESGSSDVFKTLLKVVSAKDEPEPSPSLISRPEHVLMKRINFDAEMSSVSSNGDPRDGLNDLEYVKVISSTLEQTESGKKLCNDLLEAQLVSEFNQQVKLGELMEQMENNVIPSLEKLFKDPIRIHDVIRQVPPEIALACKIEDQEQLVESFKTLSRNCVQLQKFLYNQPGHQFDLQAQISSLESISENLESTLSILAAEKIKFQKLQSLLTEIDSEVVT